MPKDFSQDGAFGATSQDAPPATSTASSTFNPQTFQANAPIFQPSNPLGPALAASGQLNLGFFADGGLVGGDDGDDSDDGASGSDADGDGDGDDDSAPGMGGSDPSSSPQATNDFQSRISLALNTVDDALSYGRQLHGLGDDQQAANMPAQPSSQSESGVAPAQPGPGAPAPYPGQFGRRPVRPPQQILSANMPAQPSSQSESGVAPAQPAPGASAPYPGQFGQRQVRPPQQIMGAIPDDDDQEDA